MNAANPYWSAKFLKSQEGRSEQEAKKIVLNFRSSDNLDYKQRIVAMRETAEMSGEVLVKAILKEADSSVHWIRNTYNNAGLKISEEGANALVQGLRKAAALGEGPLLNAIREKMSAEADKMQGQELVQVPAG